MMAGSRDKTGIFEIFLIYLRLGCLSFGGPVAHLGYFKDAFVTRRNWLNEATYAELLGLCQFVPGPSSSQLCFAIGWHRRGLPGACAAWVGFTLPSTLIMIGFGYGLFALEGTIKPFTHGLLIAAVAVVANATLGLGKKLCPDLPRMAIAILASTLVLSSPDSLSTIGSIFIGALIGQWLNPHTKATHFTATKSPYSINKILLFGALTLYGLLLSASLIIEPSTPGAIYAFHYRAGALVFGGGHVVLPLLNDSIVAGGLVAEGNFLAGYSIAQALPGPLFTLSAFLGTIGAGTTPAAVGGILALVAIFLPGLLLLIGLLPFWGILRQKQWAQAGLCGANAAVVGLLLAALIHPVWTHGIKTITDLSIGIIAFIALYRYQSPAWLVVIGSGIAGYIFY